ncbi:MAG TPA: hypothetical protein ENN29_12670, partial [Candidatus Hydrogenedentes bacterium]|nr:hypothetical protein [Candidatus Hydrogenedentota bacterium]
MAALFSPNIIVYAQDGAVDIGMVLDYLLSPKQIISIDVVSQWENREVLTPQPEGESPFPEAMLPVHSITEEDANPPQDEYVYYVMQMDGDEDAFGVAEGEGDYWRVEENLYIGPVENSIQYYAPFNLGGIAPKLIESAHDSYTINIYALVSISNDLSSGGIYYTQMSDPMTVDLRLVSESESDSDGNAVPDALFGVIFENEENERSWFSRNDARGVVSASLWFPDDFLAPGQNVGTARLMPDDPDYHVVVELPTANALGYSGPLVGTVQTSRDFGYLYDDAESQEILDILGVAPGSWLETGEGGMIALGVAVLHEDGAKAVNAVDDFSVPGRIEIQNLLIDLEAEDRRALGLWRYPLALKEDGVTGAYVFSLPETPGRWEPLALQVDYDETNQILSAEIGGGGAIMPMLVAVMLAVDDVAPTGVSSCVESPITLAGVFPVWMADAPDSGLTLAEATARYEVFVKKDSEEMEIFFRTPTLEIDGYDSDYAVSALDLNHVNHAFLTFPAAWAETGWVDIEIRDKENPSNSYLFENAFEVEDLPPVIT